MYNHRQMLHNVKLLTDVIGSPSNLKDGICARGNYEDGIYTFGTQMKNVCVVETLRFHL